MNLGIILISHGSFAIGAKESVEMIAGPQENLYALALTEDKNLEDLEQEINKVYDELLKHCDYVLALCDIFGGTPFNALLRSMMKGRDMISYTGLSLPLLIEVLFAKESIDGTEELIAHIEGVQNMIIKQIQIPALDEVDDED